MSSADFDDLTGTLSSNVVRGVTDSGGAGVPSGGGTFPYGIGRTGAGADGVVGMFYNAAGWIPTPKGGTVTCAMVKAGKGTDLSNNLIYSPFLFCNLQGANTTDLGYVLGLSEEEEPSRIVLAKIALTTGLGPGGDGVLRLSSDTVTKGAWVHLRLDVIEQPAGDVLLKCFRNTGSVTAPSWEEITGMADFTDDALAYETGTLPLTSGRMGYGARMGTESGRYLYFDQFAPQQDNT